MQSFDWNSMMTGLGSAWKRVAPWLWLVALLWLFGWTGISWLLGGLFTLVIALTVLPIAAIAGLAWWAKRQVVIDDCPVCGAPIAGFPNAMATCTNCGTAVIVVDGQLRRAGDPGTIDVGAVEVTERYTAIGSWPTNPSDHAPRPASQGDRRPDPQGQTIDVVDVQVLPPKTSGEN